MSQVTGRLKSKNWEMNPLVAIFKVCTSILVEKLRRNTKNLGQNILSCSQSRYRFTSRMRS